MIRLRPLIGQPSFPPPKKKSLYAPPLTPAETKILVLLSASVGIFFLNYAWVLLVGLVGHFFVLWYLIDVSPAMFEMLISKEIVDGK